MSNPYWFSAVPFPNDAWASEFRDLDKSPTSYLEESWYDKVKLPCPSPDAIKAECEAVLAAQADLPLRKAEIKQQAINAKHTIAPVVQAMGPPPFPALKTAMMLGEAINDLTCGVFHFKKTCNRGRVYHCCNLPIEPMFMRPDRLYPGHPSYPSGHSSQAHVAAQLLAEILPGRKQDLLAAAGRVARNREIAGLHFATDSQGGLVLAQQFVALLIKVPRFAALLTAAKTEWP